LQPLGKHAKHQQKKIISLKKSSTERLVSFKQNIKYRFKVCFAMFCCYLIILKLFDCISRRVISLEEPDYRWLFWGVYSAYSADTYKQPLVALLSALPFVSRYLWNPLRGGSNHSTGNSS